MMSEKLNIAVVGATGAVGEAMLSILAENGFADCNIAAPWFKCRLNTANFGELTQWTRRGWADN